MSYYFGLYYGNTNLCLAVYRNGKGEVLANSSGDRLTPASVAYLDGEHCVGTAAKQCMLRNVGDTITNVKDLLSHYLNLEDEDGDVTATSEQNGHTRRMKPYEATVLLFKNMVGIARSHCHETDVPVVVTVPFKFSLKLRKMIGIAASEAGFRLLRVISEPSAAMLAYDVGQNVPRSHFNCLVYRVGGTSIDVSIFRVFGGMYRSLASLSKKDLGGTVFTNKLVSFVAAEFQRKYKVDVKENKRSVMKLMAAAEDCKHALSIKTSSQCFAESIYDGIDLSTNVSQARFESLIGSELQQCYDVITETLDEACLTESEIDTVVLTGGSCKIPKLQRFITEKFSSGIVLSSILPDEAIALGAAKEAMIISQAQPLTEHDCHVSTLSNTIYLRRINGCYPGNNDIIPLFDKGVPIPISHQIKLPGDKAIPVSMEICEEHCETIETHVKVLAKFTVQPSEGVSLDVELTQDRNLKLSCKDITTGFSKLLI